VSDGGHAGGGELDAELRASIEARRQLGPEYDEVLAEGLGARIDAEIARRVEEKLAAERRAAQPLAVRGPAQGRPDSHDLAGPEVGPGSPAPAAGSPRGVNTGLAIASLALGVPITAVAGGAAHLPGVVVAWVGIVAINVADGLARRSNRH